MKRLMIKTLVAAMAVAAFGLASAQDIKERTLKPRTRDDYKGIFRNHGRSRCGVRVLPGCLASPSPMTKPNAFSAPSGWVSKRLMTAGA